ncbi:reverse transcriptase family protein, partial [Candidatus Magnetomorum sp. HK-1]
FREARGCADAIAQVFNALSKPNSATWVLEGDIKGCFDHIVIYKIIFRSFYNIIVP